MNSWAGVGLGGMLAIPGTGFVGSLVVRRGFLVRKENPEVIFRVSDLSGQSSCPRCVNLFGMWRVQRLDQINRFKAANPFDFKSLTLKFRSEQIGRFKTTNRSERGGILPPTPYLDL